MTEPKNTVEYYSLEARADSILQVSRAGTKLSPKSSSITRLFVEDPGIRGSSWLHPYNEQRFHVFGNVARFILSNLLSPFFYPFPVMGAVVQLGSGDTTDVFSGQEDNERKYIYQLPDAVLRYPPGYSDPGRVPLVNSSAGVIAYRMPASIDVYETTNVQPHWMLEVQIRDGKYAAHRQINWTADGQNHEYSAISYGMRSAFVLFEEAGKQALDEKPEGKEWSLADRRRISEQLLIEFCSTARRGNHQVPPNRTEYIWLDEFCISENGEENHDDKVRKERKEELGRMADIFRGAETVIVFCHILDCDHTTLDCPWGNRLFTLGEILHANSIGRMTRTVVEKNTKARTFLEFESARSFRERMMYYAAQARRWHLHSLLRNSINSGSSTWQMAIHALMVEAIRRDRETGYKNHKLLGQGLNGLLPRRACLHHLKGEDGWVDLAWLLELNQGFYNAASLAAICDLNDTPQSGNGWLGPPIEPKAGSERLEPLVHAFPIGAKDRSGNPTAFLNIVGAETIEIQPSVKRDGRALFNNPVYKWKKIVSTLLLFLFWLIGIILISVSLNATIAVLYVSSVIFNTYRLIVSTSSIEHDGWVFLSKERMNDGSNGDIAWGSYPEYILGQFDAGLGELVEWGEQQMVPKWNVSEPQFKIGYLVDLRSKIKIKVAVTERPNCMAVLAVHGTGVTYMLLNRQDGADEVAKKVGMVNLPPYTLAYTRKSGSLRVGLVEEREEKKKPCAFMRWWNSR
ncbi:hypothetical protein VKT23_010913 [Stygiomarasmius scandens]|uniref:Heterokaryon incompatibility domain-containing protein n=1 Tax=Marasmiellus scandens TaxID=2682957 RepID=A0ABR1JBF4_9AGAR